MANRQWVRDLHSDHNLGTNNGPSAALNADWMMASGRMTTLTQKQRSLRITEIRVDRDQKEQVGGLTHLSPKTRQEVVLPTEAIPSVTKHAGAESGVSPKVNSGTRAS